MTETQASSALQTGAAWCFPPRGSSQISRTTQRCRSSHAGTLLNCRVRTGPWPSPQAWDCISTCRNGKGADTLQVALPSALRWALGEEPFRLFGQRKASILCTYIISFVIGVSWLCYKRFSPTGISLTVPYVKTSLWQIFD